MARTVDELRNDIRTAVGYDFDTDRLPPKSQMRAGIRAAIGEAATDDPDEAGGRSGRQTSSLSPRHSTTNPSQELTRRRQEPGTLSPDVAGDGEDEHGDRLKTHVPELQRKWALRSRRIRRICNPLWPISHL